MEIYIRECNGKASKAPAPSAKDAMRQSIGLKPERSAEIEFIERTSHRRLFAGPVHCFRATKSLCAMFYILLGSVRFSPTPAAWGVYHTTRCYSGELAEPFLLAHHLVPTRKRF